MTTSTSSPIVCSTRCCIRSVSASIGFCQPGQVDEHELRVVVREDAANPLPRRVRDRGDDRDLGADERVDERRLADVGAAGDGGEARLHSGRLHASGSRSAAGLGCDRAVLAAEAHLTDPPLVEPLPAAAARRGGDADRSQVAGPVAPRRPQRRSPTSRHRRRADRQRSRRSRPANSRPSTVRTTAPTWYREYGAYACAATASAFSTSSLTRTPGRRRAPRARRAGRPRRPRAPSGHPTRHASGRRGAP